MELLVRFVSLFCLAYCRILLPWKQNVYFLYHVSFSQYVFKDSAMILHFSFVFLDSIPISEINTFFFLPLWWWTLGYFQSRTIMTKITLASFLGSHVFISFNRGMTNFLVNSATKCLFNFTCLPASHRITTCSNWQQSWVMSTFFILAILVWIY